MLVEINLLPKKEAKKFGLSLILAVFLLLFLMIVTFFYLIKISYTNEIQSINKQLVIARGSTALEQKNSNVNESSNAVAQLKKSIEWANGYSFKTIPLLKRLTSLLPERGFIQTFAYDETGIIKLSVQFDSEDETAFFLSRLNGCSWIEQANLLKLAAASTTDSPTSSTTNENDNTAYLPRYLADFELKVNKGAFKAGIGSGTEGEEGK